MLIVSSIELDKTLRGATPKILGTPDDLEVSDNVTIKTDTARIKITIMSIIMFTILLQLFHKGSPLHLDFCDKFTN